MIYPTRLHRRWELRRMRRLLGTAAAIVTTTSEAARKLRQEFPELTDRPIVSIPCGFDRATRRAGAEDERPRLPDRPHRLLHPELSRQQRHASLPRRLLSGGTAASTSSPAPTSSCSRRSSG